MVETLHDLSIFGGIILKYLFFYVNKSFPHVMRTANQPEQRKDPFGLTDANRVTLTVFTFFPFFLKMLTGDWSREKTQKIVPFLIRNVGPARSTKKKHRIFFLFSADKKTYLMSQNGSPLTPSQNSRSFAWRSQAEIAEGFIIPGDKLLCGKSFITYLINNNKALLDGKLMYCGVSVFRAEVYFINKSFLHSRDIYHYHLQWAWMSPTFCFRYLELFLRSLRFRFIRVPPRYVGTPKSQPNLNWILMGMWSILIRSTISVWLCFYDETFGVLEFGHGKISRYLCKFRLKNMTE